MTDRKPEVGPRLKHISLKMIPTGIVGFHHLAEQGKADSVRGRKVKFDLFKADEESSNLFKNGETLWLIYDDQGER